MVSKNGLFLADVALVGACMAKRCGAFFLSHYPYQISVQIYSDLTRVFTPNGGLYGKMGPLISPYFRET